MSRGRTAVILHLASDWMARGLIAYGLALIGRISEANLEEMNRPNRLLRGQIPAKISRTRRSQSLRHRS
jgi:hypothetical protein